MTTNRKYRNDLKTGTGIHKFMIPASADLLTAPLNVVCNRRFGAGRGQGSQSEDFLQSTGLYHPFESQKRTGADRHLRQGMRGAEGNGLFSRRTDSGNSH